MRQNVWLPGPAHRSSPDLGAGLAARFDRDPGWSPWPTPCIQTRTIAFTAPRVTSPAQSPTSPGHGWPSHLPSQRLQSRTASTVLARSKPASNRPYAGCTKPLVATPGDLAGLLADMERVGSCRRSWLASVRPGGLLPAQTRQGHCRGSPASPWATKMRQGEPGFTATVAPALSL